MLLLLAAFVAADFGAVLQWSFWAAPVASIAIFLTLSTDSLLAMCFRPVGGEFGWQDNPVSVCGNWMFSTNETAMDSDGEFRSPLEDDSERDWSFLVIPLCCNCGLPVRPILIHKRSPCWSIRLRYLETVFQIR